MQKIFTSLICLVGALCMAMGAEKKVSVTVSAGNYDRHQTIVSFHLPAEAGALNQVRDANGQTAFLQIDGDGTAWFIVDQLAKGKTAAYDLLGGPMDMKGTRIEVQREKTMLKLSRSGQSLLDYQAEPSQLPRPEIDPVFQRGAYIHPVTTLSGKIVTDHYPPNHLHQDGIFFAWTKTEFQGRQPDFWNLKDKKGRVEFVALGKTWSGPVQGGFTSFHRFIDLTSGSPLPALNETWLVRVYNNPSKTSWLFDITSTQKCAGPDPLKLPEYHYGGFGFRGNWAWNGKGQCNFLTSEGVTDRVKGNGAPGRWCDVWGKLDGAEAGIAILGHPDNFRAPQPLRLHPSEPYISFAPQIAGPFEIAPGTSYVTRFRFVVHDGPPTKEEIERCWNDYAYPPEVQVEIK